MVLGHAPLDEVLPAFVPHTSFPGAPANKKYKFFIDFVRAKDPSIVQIYNLCQSPLACLPPWNVFIKDEPTKNAKLAENRPRTINGPTAAVRVEQIRLGYDFSKRILAQHHTKPLKNAWSRWHGGITQMHEYLTADLPSGGWFFEWDVSEFDLRLHRFFVEVIQQFFVETRDPNLSEGDRNADENIWFDSYTHLSISHDGHVWWLEWGNASGNYRTAIDNGLANFLIYLGIWWRFKGKEYARRWREFTRPAITGDDLLAYSTIKPPTEEWLTDFFSSLGMTLKKGSYKVSRSFVGHSFAGCVFVKTSFGALVGVLKAEKALAKLGLFRSDWDHYRVCQTLESFRAETLYDRKWFNFTVRLANKLDSYAHAYGLTSYKWRPIFELEMLYALLSARGTCITLSGMPNDDKHTHKAPHKKGHKGKEKKVHQPKNHGKGKGSSSSMTIKRVNQPSAFGGTMTRGDNGPSSYRLRGSDFFGSITIPNANANVTGAALRWQALNPLTMANSRIRNFAKLFQDYRVRKFSLRGIANQGTTVGGNLCGFFDTDVARITSQQGDQMLAYAMSHKMASIRAAWQPINNMACPLDNKWRKCNNGEGDPRESVFAVFVMLVSSPPTAANYPFSLYELIADYDIEFRNPMVQDLGVGSSLLTLSLAPGGSPGSYPYTSKLLNSSPNIPFAVGIAIVTDPGATDVTPGGVYYVARDQNNNSGVVLTRAYDAAYVNGTATGASMAVPVTWSAMGNMTIVVSPISAPFVDVNADGAGFTNSTSGVTPNANEEAEGVLCEFNGQGTIISTFEDMNAKLPDANEASAVVEVEAEFLGGVAPQGYGVAFTSSGGFEVQLGEEVVLGPTTAFQLSLDNDPISQYLAKKYMHSTSLYIPGLWSIFTKLGQLLRALVAVSSNIRTSVRAIRERRANIISTKFFMDENNRKELAIPSHLRWLRTRPAEMFLAADEAGILDWVDEPFNYDGVRLMRKRPFIRGTITFQPFEDFRNGGKADGAKVEPDNQLQSQSSEHDAGFPSVRVVDQPFELVPRPAAPSPRGDVAPAMTVVSMLRNPAITPAVVPSGTAGASTQQRVESRFK